MGIHFDKLWKSNITFISLPINSRGTLYIGITSNIVKRIYEHKNKKIDGFSKKYSCNRLVYCQSCNDVNVAIKREKLLKKWNRIWKIELIEKTNPNWNDLYENGSPLL